MEKLKEAENAFLFGIIGLAGLFVACGPFAIIFSIIGYRNSKKAQKIIAQNPNTYTNKDRASTGKTLSIIGIVLSILGFIALALYLVLLVFLSFSDDLSAF